MPLYRKRPVVIEAIEYVITNRNEILAWCPDADVVTGHLVILTLEGAMTVSPGDYVIKGVQGEFYPCKPDIFAATYELAQEQS